MTEYRSLNTDALREEIKTATVSVLAAFRHQVPDETPYAFALYTSGDGGYVIPSLNTEEALLRIAVVYAAKDDTPDNLGLHAASLRWSPCDWEYHSWNEGVFEASQRRISDYRWIVTRNEVSGVDRYDTYDRAQPEEVYQTCLAALSELNDEGILGEGAARERLMVTLLMGDQSDEGRLEWARLCNPSSVSERMETELRQRLEASSALFGARHAVKPS